MIQYIYSSASTKPFTNEELLELLARARSNNQRLQLTGMLLYKDGDFMQVLEGDDLAVRELRARIAKDPRHKDLVTLQETSCTQREFPDWSMGFHNLDNMDPREIDGYTTFMDSPLRADNFAKTPSLARTFLLSCRSKLVRV